MIDTLHLVVDLETASTKSNAAVVSIGVYAVGVAPEISEPPRVREVFYGHLELSECVQLAGLHVNKKDMDWWRTQDVAMMDEAFKGVPRHLYEDSKDVLNHLAVVIQDTKKNYKNVRVWGNGANFDPVVLENCYAGFGLPVPWEFRSVRCLRTLLCLLPPELRIPQDPKTKHHALEDAKHEALNLEATLIYLRSKGVPINAL